MSIPRPDNALSGSRDYSHCITVLYSKSRDLLPVRQTKDSYVPQLCSNKALYSNK